MANETNNQTATNDTAEDGNLTAIIDTVEESGMLDAIMDEPLLMAMAALVLGMAGYIAYTVPAVKELVFKYLKNNEAELMGLLDKNLTKAQMKVFEKFLQELLYQICCALLCSFQLMIIQSSSLHWS